MDKVTTGVAYLLFSKYFQNAVRSALLFDLGSKRNQYKNGLLVVEPVFRDECRNATDFSLDFNHGRNPRTTFAF